MAKERDDGFTVSLRPYETKEGKRGSYATFKVPIPLKNNTIAKTQVTVFIPDKVSLGVEQFKVENGENKGKPVSGYGRVSLGNYWASRSQTQNNRQNANNMLG